MYTLFFLMKRFLQYNDIKPVYIVHIGDAFIAYEYGLEGSKKLSYEQLKKHGKRWSFSKKFEE